MGLVKKIKLTFNEGLLGTSPGDPEVYKKFIATKAPDATTLEEEVAALGEDAVIENGMTIFPKDSEGRRFLYDYQIKGFLKDACSSLRRVSGTESKKLKAYKKIIDGLIFVNPRQIPIRYEGEIEYCQRSLRAQTAQGERVALAISEEIPAGASIEFEIHCLSDEHEKVVEEWLDYGELRGLGQWRNSGKGRFS